MDDRSLFIRAIRSARRANGRVCLLLVVLATLPMGCVRPAEPRIQTGPDAVVTADGLHRVDGVPIGTLFIRRDYQFGEYAKFFLGETMLTMKPGARALDAEEIVEVKRRFNAVARRAIVEMGREEVSAPGACVAIVELALINLDLASPSGYVGARTSVVDSFGEVTLMVEIRDGPTDQPLLRYGQRRLLEGGSGAGPDPAKGKPLTATFERFAVDFRRDFESALPRLEATSRPLACTQRAGLAPITHAADADRELERALRLAPDVTAGGRTFENCAACHGATGGGRTDGSVPKLAGQHRTVVLRQLADIRAGNRDNATMYAFATEARMGGTQAVADVAAYVAKLAPVAETEQGPGTNLALGEKLYGPRCGACHGPNGEGDASRYIPRIQAQHYSYLARRLQVLSNEEHHKRVREMQGLSAEEGEAILDYLSRLEAR